MEEVKATWPDGLEDELVKELLDNESPFFVLPQETSGLQSSVSAEAANDQLISALYSGPTIQDIANALSITFRKILSPEVLQARISQIDRSSNQLERYTLKIKNYANNISDDGYKWRKYGQKTIKNSPNPRSYYRCANPRCSAKKQVERCKEDPETLIVTYEGLHLHFAYPYFLPNDDHDGNRPVKKNKKTISKTKKQSQEAHESSAGDASEPLRSLSGDSLERTKEDAGRFQGLLEDLVPFMVRNPSNDLFV